MDKKEIKNNLIKKIKYLFNKDIENCTNQEVYQALGTVIKEYIIDFWYETNKQIKKENPKKVYYFSAEFLTGKFLKNNLKNLAIYQDVKEVLNELSIDLKSLEKEENEQGLGNGGLGRLAACFLDSIATLEIPGYGVGLRYNKGLFKQKIKNGEQVETADNWLKDPNIWEIKIPSESVNVRFGGKIIYPQDSEKNKYEHVDYNLVKAIPYDMPIVGYKNNFITSLRLWDAQPINKGFDFERFSSGDYINAFKDQHQADAITQVLYPNDNIQCGKILRLKQEYFLVSAGLQNIVNKYIENGLDINEFYKYNVIQINDTHPALAIPEFMRILLDEQELEWKEAWKITKKTFAYTNHTIMSEALESWHKDLMKHHLPRIYMIIKEINRRFCDKLFNEMDMELEEISDIAIISHHMIHMAHLAIIGSFSVNGVAKLHTKILKEKELNKFYQIYPEKFNNKTNGITPRRWLLNSNEKLTNLIDDTLGKDWQNDISQLQKLENFKDIPSFKQKISSIKLENKKRLAKYIKKNNNIEVDPHSIFDVHAKRLHEYKRQLLNVLHIMHLYNKIKNDKNFTMHKRTFIFAAKAAPGYYLAKKIIKLINVVAKKINNDPEINDLIKVVFLENYSVSIAEILMPAADVSEQISTASKEASGTGNMKLMMNGAITLGTLDGANIEIKDAVGNDNIVIFGLRKQEVYNLYESQNYHAYECYNINPEIKKVIDQLINGFLPCDNNEFREIYDSLLKYNDNYFVLKDFISYANAQAKIDKLYKNQSKWLTMAIVNIANSYIFSSDRTIKDYCNDIWKVNYKK